MKRWMLTAALFGVLVVTTSPAWSQVNLGLEPAAPEQEIGRAHV